MPEGNPTSHGTPYTWAQVQEGREPHTTCWSLDQTLTSLDFNFLPDPPDGRVPFGRGVSVRTEDHSSHLSRLLPCTNRKCGQEAQSSLQDGSRKWAFEGCTAGALSPSHHSKLLPVS